MRIGWLAGLAFLCGATAPGAPQTFPTTGPSKIVVNLVCIGDSITECKIIPERERNGSPAVLARALADGLGNGATVHLANTGRSGTTTVGWAGEKGLLAKLAEPAAKKLAAEHPEGKLVFSVMLGTNDSANKGPKGSPVSAETYAANLRSMVADLERDFPGCVVFLHHPTWYSANTHNTSDYEGDSARGRLLSYLPAIDAIVADDAGQPSRHVFLGDVAAYDYFDKNHEAELTPEKGQNGTFYLHPNVKGAESLGKFWAAPIVRALKTP